MIILALETSCDETAASIVETEGDSIRVLSNIVSSQTKLHSKWGGVVPNLAARVHLKNIVPVIQESLRQAKSTPKSIDLIAVTEGPGLIPALLIGVNTAKTLSYAWKKPLIGIHHIEGHIYANFICDKIGVSSKLQITNSKPRKIASQSRGEKIQNSKVLNSKPGKIKFPLLCLTVSGGHTQLVLMRKHLQYEIIGQTLDDAAGEAFDKVARILGLGYPGGPAIAERAANHKSQITCLAGRQANHKKNRDLKIIPDIQFTRPMIGSKNFDFSFSGLKTAVLYETKKHPRLLRNKDYVGKICHEFQQAVIDVLISKTISAAKKYKAKTIMLAGGVSANLELRKQLGKAVLEQLPDAQYRVPGLKYSLDNAAMVATAAAWRWRNTKNKKTLCNNWKILSAEANLELN